MASQLLQVNSVPSKTTNLLGLQNLPLWWIIVGCPYLELLFLGCCRESLPPAPESKDFILPLYCCLAACRLCIPDVLSKSLIRHPTLEDEFLCVSAVAHLRTIMTANVVISSDETSAQDANRTLQQLQAAARTDPLNTRILNHVISGFPSNTYDLHSSLIPVWKIRNDLSPDGKLVLYEARTVVPAALCCHTHLHTWQSQRCRVYKAMGEADWILAWYWLRHLQHCPSLRFLQGQQQEPFMCDNTPTRSFESVSADIFTVAGEPFLLLIDRSSEWSIVPCKCDATGPLQILQGRWCFLFTGIGFRDFMERWGDYHTVTAPHVKSIKHLILKTAPSGNTDCEDFYRSLLELFPMQ